MLASIATTTNVTSKVVSTHRKTYVDVDAPDAVILENIFCPF